MLEIFINKTKDDKQIALTQNGKLVEFYKENKSRNEGNIFIGIVKDVLDGMEAAFVDIGLEKNAYINLKNLLPKVDEKKNVEENNIKIGKLVKANDPILVQVKRDGNGQKGAKISTHISLPSKYIVFMPNTDIITVSQKIDDKNEQKRLIELVRANLSKENGAVIRTASKGKTDEVIQDIKYMESIWKSIKKKYEAESKEPKLIYKCQDIVKKMLIDLVNKDLTKIISNDEETINETKDELIKSKEYSNINLELRKECNILDTYDIQKQIDKIEDRKVWLKSGGFIIIDKTEALTAIDVNTGKFTGGKNLADIIYKVNEEATKEIAKQIRLRDIGGIIVIDYIDMLREDDKKKIEVLLKKYLDEDRAKTQVEGFSKLDLMELTRQHICSK